MRNHLICWEENGKKKWEMVRKKDSHDFLLELIQNPNVTQRTIFIIPLIMTEGIWLFPKFHKSNRVDFYHFFEDYGTPYTRPEVSERTAQIVNEIKAKRGPETKYGFVSPDGRYFHCDYQGHGALADNICFGMVDTNNSERYLQDHGWCKIYNPLGARQYNIFLGENCRMTDAQAKTLTKMGLDIVEDFSNMMLRRN